MKLISMYKLSFASVVGLMLITTTPLRATSSDDKIETAFENSYVYKTYLKNDSIKTNVDKGVFTLTGTVSDESNKGLAQETAANLPGVVSVNNKLTTNAEAATKNSDIWIGRKIKMTLLFHRYVNYSNTNVAVKDGIVTLTGEAVSSAQKDLTTEYAKDIDGVKDVKNEMTVAVLPPAVVRTAGEKIDDASVTARVKMTLLNHHSTSAISTGVVTVNGDVTLTGIAKNDAEKTLVTKLVTDIDGVASVNNSMTIK